MAASMTKRAAAGALAAVFALPAGQVFAMSLVEAYQAALQNDPVYQSAVHDNEAGQQNRAIGRSYLLPNIGLNYAKYKNRADITQPNIFGQTSTSQPEYDSKSASVTLRQPLFSLDSYARYKQGAAQADYSDAVFSSKGQDLLQRLVGAYADAKFAEDQLALVTAQRDALEEQRKVNERMFQKGEGTKTDMLETQARYDLAEAQLLESRNNLASARNTLAAIVGVDVNELDQLRDDFKVKLLQPGTFEEWKAIALDRNPDLAAQRYYVEASRQEVTKQRAGHTPRIDFIASYSKGSSETLTTLNQESTNRTVGVQLSMPIYAGGGVSASTSQAVASLEKAKSDLDAKTKQLMVELRKQYDAVTSGAARIEASEKSVKSAELLVQATEQSVKGGVRINLDVLNAQQQLFTARRDLAQARYTYMLAYLRLHTAAGTLNGEVLNDVAKYFVPGSGAKVADRAALNPFVRTAVLAKPATVVNAGSAE